MGQLWPSPLHDPGRLGLRLFCSPFFKCLNRRASCLESGGEGRLAALQSTGSVFTEESKQLDSCFHSELINLLPGLSEVCLLSSHSRWSRQTGHW